MRGISRLATALRDRSEWLVLWTSMPGLAIPRRVARRWVIREGQIVGSLPAQWFFGSVSASGRGTSHEDSSFASARHIVVEGFPRSGTTFVERFVSLSSADRVVVIGHAHNVFAACLERPDALVVIPVRNPAEAIQSQSEWQRGGGRGSYWARVRPKRALAHWIRFYEAAEKMSRVRSVEFVKFEDVSSGDLLGLLQVVAGHADGPSLRRAYEETKMAVAAHDVDAPPNRQHWRPSPAARPGLRRVLDDQRYHKALTLYRRLVDAD